MMKPHVAMIPLALVVLAGCSQQNADPGSISNVPSGSASSVSSPAVQTSSPSNDSESTGQASADPANQPAISPSHRKTIVGIMDRTADRAPDALRTSATTVQDTIVKPYYSGQVSAMQWITLIALGAHLDADSLTEDSNGVFTGNLVDGEGTVLAEVAGVLRDGEINPNDYDQTDAGDDFRAAHQDVAQTWATN